MKKTNLNLFLTATLVAASYAAQAINWTGDITGQVIEQESKQPVAFAKVIFVNGSETVTVTANEYGYYTVKHLPLGKYEMQVVFNNRNFIKNDVKVKDSYTARVDFAVSSSNDLPAKVQVADAKNDAAPAGNVKNRNGQIAQPSPATSSHEETVKYGMVIQDGQIMIIRNKPVTLYA